MAYDKSWTFLLNQTLADESVLLQQSRSIIMKFKDTLVANGWTVMQSSNQVTAGSSDLWLTLNNLNWGTNTGAARSWITLKSPVGFIAGPNGSYTGDQSRVSICIDLAGTAGSNWYLYIAPGATTGTASVLSIPSASPGFQAAYASPFHLGSGLPVCRVHFGFTSEGGFYFAVSQLTTFKTHLIVYCLPLVEVQKVGANDYPYACIFGAYYADSLTNLSFSTLFTACKMLSPTGVLVTNVRPMALQISGGSIFPGNGTSAGAGDVNGNLLTFNAYLGVEYTSGTYKYAMVGKLPDICFCVSSGLTNNSVLPATGDITHNLVYQTFLPANIAFAS